MVAAALASMCPGRRGQRGLEVDALEVEHALPNLLAAMAFRLR